MRQPTAPPQRPSEREESMQTDVERFLHILETERGFSVNTIFAYRNDLTQFLAFLLGESGDAAVRDSAETPDRQDMNLAPNQMLNVFQWNQLTDDELTSYLLYLRTRKYASSTIARKMAAIKSFFNFLI